MKSLIVAISVITLQIAEAHIIPYDWANQFGVIDYKNSILWNRDWRSNGLSFDGTWIIYPNMLGNEIKEGFEKENNVENKLENQNINLLNFSLFLYRKLNFFTSNSR